MLVLVNVSREIARDVAARLEAHPIAPTREYAQLPDMEEFTTLNPCLVVLGVGAEHAMEQARVIKASLPDTAILVLASAERRAELDHALLLTPFHGARVRVAQLGPGAVDAILSELEAAELGRQQRLIVTRLNRTLGATPAPESIESYLEELVGLAPFGLIVASTEGDLLSVNAQARALTGFDPVRTRKARDLVAQEDRPLVDALVQGAASHGIARLRLARDPSRWIEARAGLATRRGGERVLLLVADVTGSVANEKALAKARAELARSEKLSLLGEVVGGVAHEVRTPLTALQNHLALMRLALDRSPPESGNALKSLETNLQGAQESLERIGRLVADMRRLSQGQPGPRRPLDLRLPVADALDFLERTAGRGVRLERRLAPTLPVEMDAFQVQQVVINLVNNAVDASQPGGRVLVETCDAPQEALLRVSDEGSGIPPEILARLFETFVTTKPKGTGLGLGIVRRIVESHGGTLEIETEPGKGTQVVARWPHARQAAATNPLQAGAGIGEP